jgi:hypothetical protein
MYPIAQLLFLIIVLLSSFSGITLQLQRSQGSVHWCCSGSSLNFPRTNGAFELNSIRAESNTTNIPPVAFIGRLLALCNLVPLSRSFASPLLACSRLKRYVRFPDARYSNAQTNSVTATPPPHRESSTELQRCAVLNDHQGKHTLACLCFATYLLTVMRNSHLSRKPSTMPYYHDNKLAMVGIDSDDDVKPCLSPKPAKRKRSHIKDDMTAMQDFASHADGATGSQETLGDIYTVNDQVNQDQGYEPPFDLWNTNAFTEAYTPYGDWFLNDYSSASSGAGTAAPQIVFPTTNANFAPAPESDDMPAGPAPANDNAAVANGTVQVKAEVDDEQKVSLFPLSGSEYDESDCGDRRPSKSRKLNKDGVPRKPRQPRPRLLKWDDNDWKNVALGLVWACGENGIQIPFDQASQIVSESCTSGALQQALLKLRGKQISEGFQIPSLRMAWTRKNKSCASSKSSTDVNPSQEGIQKPMPPKRKSTRFAGNQSLIVTLKRAYKDADRCHLAVPYVPAVASSDAQAQVAQQALPTPSSMYTALDLLTANATSNSPPVFPGHFAIGTPPTTPGGRTTWAPVDAQPYFGSHGQFAPQYALAGNAPAISASNQPSFSTIGNVMMPQAPLNDASIKRHRRRMTMVEPDLNYPYHASTPPNVAPSPPAQPRSTSKTTKRVRVQLPPGHRDAGSPRGHAARPRKSATMDWTYVNGQLVTKEDLDLNFGWTHEDYVTETDATCHGTNFPPSSDFFDGAGGTGGSCGLAA